MRQKGRDDLRAPEGLRPLLEQDIPALGEIFDRAIRGLAADDYDQNQCNAWAILVDSPEFAKRLLAGITLVALSNGEIVGFGSLSNGKEIDMLYTDPDYAGQGVGSYILNALEIMARTRKAEMLTANISENALEFFTNRGFAGFERRTVFVQGEWLAQTHMQKILSTLDHTNYS